jgi:hypothetical protein
MRLHVMFGKGSGADGFPFIVQGDNGHRDSIGIHSRTDVVEPIVDGAAGIEMSPLAEVPLRNDGRKSGQSARALIFMLVVPSV